MEETKYCKKLIVNHNGVRRINLGLVLNEDDEGFDFLTGRGNLYHINKKSEYYIFPTTILFEKSVNE
jgi:hypothetical protein